MGTTKPNRPALILVDIQQGFEDVGYWGEERNNPDAEVRASELLKIWRGNNLPIFHIQHCSSIPTSLLHETNPGNQFNSLVAPAAGEPIIKKNVNSAFIGTDLQRRLDRAEITTLIIAGLTTDHCISTTTRMAANLGYKTFLVADATATFNKKGFDGQNYPAQIIHETALASLNKEFATVVTSDFIKRSVQKTSAGNMKWLYFVFLFLMSSFYTTAQKSTGKSFKQMKTMSNPTQELTRAEDKAKELFRLIEERRLITPGKSEKELSDEIANLAMVTFGIERYWHKKIVRTGKNTLHSFSANPPDLKIQNDDIVFIDFAPVVDGWEADLGRTYVIGNNPLKLKLKRDVDEAWQVANTWYAKQTKLTGAEFFNYLTALAKQYGWEFGGEIGGHIVGPFPHEQPDDPNDLCLDVHPDNHNDILQADKNGNRRHWILEIQFIDRKNNIGAYIEQLLK